MELNEEKPIKKKPYGLVAFEKAMEEGRVMIDNRDGKEHRRYSITLRPTQVLRSMKDCLTKKEYDASNEDELLATAKKMIDTLININSENSDILYRHFRGRLEKHYRSKRSSRQRLARGGF